MGPILMNSQHLLKYAISTSILSVYRASDSASESDTGSEGSKDGNVDAQGSDRKHKNLGKLTVLVAVNPLRSVCMALWL